MASGPQGWWRPWWDRIVASDPGLNRLRIAGSAAIGMGSAMAVEYGYTRLAHSDAQTTTVAMLLGTVVALMGSMALTGSGAWRKTVTAVFFPVSIGIGLVIGTLVADVVDLMLSVFVVVTFVAVFVRRFGPAYFFYGFMLWMGFFFAAFLHATMAMLPGLLLYTVIGAAWVLLLSITVLRANPRRALMRTTGAFGARARAVARVCAELADLDPGEAKRAEQWQRRVQTAQNRLAESALIIEGWSVEPGALPEGWSATALRRHLVDAQLAIEEAANAVKALAVEGDREVIVKATRIARMIAHRRYEAAGRAATELLDRTAGAGGEQIAGWWPLRHFGIAVTSFAANARSFETALASGPGEEFEPVVALVNGGDLPGSAAVAGAVPPRGGRWNPFGRLDFTTRQAVQAAVAGALAIVVGRELSAVRYYWAVIATFIAFTGTATRSETFLKAVNRVLGTLTGLFAGLALAHLTSGHTIWVLVAIVASMFCGFYLLSLSYAYMIFFVTIMVSQLYSVLNELSADLLVLRLEETAIGAAVGIVVALVVTPLSTRDTVGSVQKDLLTELGALVAAAGNRLTADDSTDDLDALSRGLDYRLRQLLLVAAPLTRSLLWGNDSRLARHRLILYSSSTHYARRLAATLRPSATAAHDLARACVALAEACTALAEASGPPGRRGGTPAEQAQAHLAEAEAALFARSMNTGTTAEHPAYRPLTHLWQLLSELAAAGPVPDRTPAPQLPRATGAASAETVHSGWSLSGNVPAGAGIPIQGVVRTGSGRTLAGATLTLIDAAGRQRGKADSGDAGRYRVIAPDPGIYLLVAFAPGHEASASRVMVAAEPFTLDLTLHGSAMVTGTVTADAAKPVAGANVNVVSGHGQVVAHTRTDRQGRFTLTELIPGDYNLVVTAADFAPAARLIRVVRRQTVQADLRLTPAVQLRGQVTAGPDQRPAAHVRITLLDKDGLVVATTDTDAVGEYRFTDLPPGQYTVTAGGLRAVTRPVSIRRTPRTTLDLDLRHAG